MQLKTARMTQTPKVFCLGLSRTGTTSLCAALETLGYRTIHYPIHLFTQAEVMGAPVFKAQLRLNPYARWRRSKEIKAFGCRDARGILQGYDAFGDLPIPLFYKELDRMFPGSKFILTTRDLDRWLTSMEWLFDEGGIIWKRGHIGNELHQAVYSTTRFDRAPLARAYSAHTEAVQAYFARRKDDFCHLTIDQGELTYERLNNFLGLENSHSGPCPKVNDARSPSKQDRINRILHKYLPLWLVRRWTCKQAKQF